MAQKRSFSTMGKPQPVTSWSYSRYTDYDKCPRFFKYKHVDRMKEGTENKAMQRGTAIHRMAELHVLGQPIVYASMHDSDGKLICTEEDFKGYHKEWEGILPNFEDEFREAHEGESRETELMLAFTKDWEKETYWKDWKGAWVRVKVDLQYKPEPTVINLTDLKTGRPNDSHRDQTKLYAIPGFLMNPDVKKVRGGLWYLDQGEIIEDEFQRKSLPALQKDWAKKTKAMLTDVVYKPKPGNACRWCPFSKAKGGPCEF